MTARTRKIVVILGASGLVAAGCGGAASSSPPSASSSQSQPARGGPDMTTLATKLGVSESALQKAFQSARSPSGEKPTDMASALAKALNLSTAKVQAALKAAGFGQGGRPPSGGAPPGASSS